MCDSSFHTLLVARPVLIKWMQTDFFARFDTFSLHEPLAVPTGSSLRWIILLCEFWEQKREKNYTFVCIIFAHACPYNVILWLQTHRKGCRQKEGNFLIFPSYACKLQMPLAAHDSSSSLCHRSHFEPRIFLVSDAPRFDSHCIHEILLLNRVVNTRYPPLHFTHSIVSHFSLNFAFRSHLATKVCAEWRDDILHFDNPTSSLCDKKYRHHSGYPLYLCS